MKITIKRLRPDDYDDIIRVWQRANLPYMPKGRDSRRYMTKQMKAFPDLFLGAYLGKELVGVAIGSDDGRHGMVNRLSVVPEHRRKGIAEKLILSCEKALRARGAVVITTLIDLPNDGSVGVFKKCGFIPHERVLYLSKRDRPDV